MSYYGKKLLAYALKVEKNIEYNENEIIKNQWEKPSLKNYPNIHFNISHSYSSVVCTISQDYPVGIDIEKVRNFNIDVAKKVCSLDELVDIKASSNPNQQFFRYWTLKESYIKAVGKGLAYPMKDVQFTIKNDLEIVSNKHFTEFLLIEQLDGYVIAVCYLKASKEY